MTGPLIQNRRKYAVYCGHELFSLYVLGEMMGNFSSGGRLFFLQISFVGDVFRSQLAGEVLIPQIVEPTRATIEVPHFFCEVSSISELKTSPKNRSGAKNKISAG